MTCHPLHLPYCQTYLPSFKNFGPFLQPNADSISSINPINRSLKKINKPLNKSHITRLFLKIQQKTLFIRIFMIKIDVSYCFIVIFTNKIIIKKSILIFLKESLYYESSGN